MSLRLSVSQSITNRLHYSHSDFKQQKQKIEKTKNRASGGYSHIDFTRNHGSGAPAEPSDCLFHNPGRLRAEQQAAVTVRYMHAEQQAAVAVGPLRLCFFGR